MSSSDFWNDVGESPYIYMRKGVAAPAPETNYKWLGRTREGGPCVLCHERQLQGLERKAKVEGSQLRLYKAKEGRNEGMREASFFFCSISL
jgi:hypothetical protein